MNYVTNKTKVLISVLIAMTLVLYFQSCKKDDLLESENNIEMYARLSDYNIFQGNKSDLIPTNGYELYEISTQLFSDYAEKQRLIKIPVGSKMTASDDGLPDFPDGTILVKTFYYFKDKKDISKGKKIIETRLLIKNNSKWNVGTYLWNDEQTDGILLTTGLNKSVNWIDEIGKGNVISYHIPNNRECATCHNSSDEIIPIGTKIRNLNMDVVRSNTTINQLTYFQNIGILNSINPSSFSQLPNSHNSSLPIPDRARAYLDVNCAHCHSQNGNASGTGLYFSYDLSLGETNITNKKTQIKNMMSAGDMPRLGTTIIDEESLLLVKAYIESL
jgi:uncharacterized repeat protein (TIGR03806 family)